MLDPKVRENLKAVRVELEKQMKETNNANRKGKILDEVEKCYKQYLPPQCNEN